MFVTMDHQPGPESAGIEELEQAIAADHLTIVFFIDWVEGGRVVVADKNVDPLFIFAKRGTKRGDRL